MRAGLVCSSPQPRSGSWLYWRRIEAGGDNPMARFGRIGGAFYVPGGPVRASQGEFGKQGRLPKWGVPPRGGGFTVKADDAASEGYRMHELAGEQFRKGRAPLAAYKRAFNAVGIDFQAEYTARYGSRATNRGLQGGSNRSA